MKTISLQVHFVFIFGLLFSAHGLEVPEAELTLKVINEQGGPIAGAHVSASFELNSDRSNEVEGKAGGDGTFVASGQTSSGHVSYGADLPGYYDTREVRNFWEEKNGRWLPWNPMVQLVLKRIVHPVPMYAKKVGLLGLEIPKDDEPIGFDLEAGDWVSPYGKGKLGDFLFKLSRQVRRDNDYDCVLELSFSNPADGIQPINATYNYGSTLKLPHNAPESNYEKKWHLKASANEQNGYSSSYQQDRNFIFRVRSVEKNGRVERAWYGKIHGDMEFGEFTSKHASIRFTYYLNPDGTPNLEFDPQKNLFRNLDSLETVSDP